ncbi:class I SAM-dependent methyltransferase [Methylophilaceae bacterium]|nr:class I SAM-dependent methyltransferase [Methylophilaceae bacterium]|tara:strand:- start:782 stop:1930 length:1149 start_codon:yes stop_codon:yes gene_type:complete
MSANLKCRSCKSQLFEPPLLSYKDSPISAQDFHNDPDQKDNNVNLDIYQCSKCNLVQHILDPVPYYKEVIRAVSVSKEMENFRIQQFKEWIELNKLSNKKYIEIGCGAGDYLDIIRKIGIKKAFGLEYSDKNLALCKTKGLEVSKGYLDGELVIQDQPQKGYDAFGIFSFMEHWPNPSEALSILWDLLAEEAYGIIEVPNFEMIQKKGLYTEFITDHIFYFDKNSLSQILQSNGFEIISIKTIWHDYILSVEVKKRTPLLVHNFMDKFNSLNNELANYIKKFNNKNIVIWGAGHQSLAIISLSGIAKHINYIVDSAHFKQNKYTSGTNIKIESPEQLENSYPDALIIIAAGYSDEVKRIISNKYPFIKNIAIVREDHLEIIE